MLAAHRTPACALPPPELVIYPSFYWRRAGGGGEVVASVAQSTVDPRGHLWSVRRTLPSTGQAGGARGPRRRGRRLRPFSCPLSLLGTLLGAARRASPTTLQPWAAALPLRLPPPGPLPRSTPAHLSPGQGKPTYLPVPHFGKYGHRGSALLATGPRRAWAVGLGRARSLESLRQILLFYLLTNISPGHKELGCYLPTHAR